MRETNYGSVPAECFGPSMARRVCPLLRLQNHVAGQVFLQGSEAVLQRGFLQVLNIRSSPDADSRLRASRTQAQEPAVSSVPPSLEYRLLAALLDNRHA